MISFKYWLESLNRDYDFYKNIIIGKLSLDRVQGLSQSINTWEPENLIAILNGLGEFKNLPQETQSQVIGQIKSGMGTLDDMIKIMSNR